MEKLHFLSEDGNQRFIFAIENKQGKFDLLGGIISISIKDGEKTVTSQGIFPIVGLLKDQVVEKAEEVVKKMLNGKGYRKVESFDPSFDPLFEAVRNVWITL